MSDEHCQGSADPLPKQVDVRRLIAAGNSISAREPLQSFRRLADMVESDAGYVDIELRFFIDEQGVRRIDGDVRTVVLVLCQRCLSAMPLPIDSTFRVAVIWSDEDAVRIPKYLDPYIVGEEAQELLTLIEDELIISVPFVSYHDAAECDVAPDSHSEQYEAEPERKENPFKVLERLKSGH